MAPMTTLATMLWSWLELIERPGLQLLLNRGDRRAGQNVAVRQDAQQIQPLALEAAPGELGDVIDFVGSHLVQNDADDLDPLAFKDRLVEIDLVNRFADAALADDDDLGVQDFARLGRWRDRRPSRPRHAPSLRTGRNPFPKPRGQRP
jgi:hypothetical protein